MDVVGEEDWRLLAWRNFDLLTEDQIALIKMAYLRAILEIREEEEKLAKILIQQLSILIALAISTRCNQSL